MTDETSAKHATINYFDDNKNGFNGRPRITLPLILEKNLKMITAQSDSHKVHQFDPTLPHQLKCREDLRRLEVLATDRVQWKRLVSYVTNKQVPEPKKLTIRLQPPRRAKQ